MRPRAFCSDIARRAGEPLAGTASHARGCLLLSYPKRLWARDALASRGLPASLTVALRRLADDRDVVTRFVAHEGEWSERVELSFFPQRRRHRSVPLEEVARLLETASPHAGERITKSIVAVCTHGVRDACCARFGGALASALRAAAGDRVEVREASHLGGDRFAPTLLVLPTGHMYGHLAPEDAPTLIDAVSRGAPLASRFRGSLWLDPLAQLAEVAAVELANGRPVSIGAVEKHDETARRATLRTTARLGRERMSVEVRCSKERRLVIGDCRSIEDDRRGTVAVWTIDGVSAVRG